MRFNKNLILNGVIGASLVSPTILNTNTLAASMNDNIIAANNGINALAIQNSAVEALVAAAEQSPNRKTVAAALDLISRIPDGPNKVGFKNRINVLFENAVATAERTTTNENVIAALELIPLVEDTITRDGYTARINTLFENAVIQVEANYTKETVAAARDFINIMPEGTLKTQYQARINALFADNFTLPRKNVSANLDVYIKSENMLSLSLDTNSVTFENYSGVEDMEKLGAVTISINSSLAYDLNAYMPTQIQNADKSSTLPISTLNIREDSEGVYQTFANTTDKLVLKADNVAGNNLTHTIDLKLADKNAHPADVYKTVIKFEAQQK